MKLKKSKRILIASSVATLILIFTVAGSLIYLGINQTPSNLEPVSITDVQVVYSSILYVAEDQGYFTQNGLNVTFPRYPTSEAGFVDLQNGKVDFVQSAEYSIVRSIIDNRDIRVVATIDKAEVANLIGRRDLGIESVSDLVGKSVGIGKGTIREFYLGRYLNLNGFSIQDINLVNLSLQESVNAIANGTIDAVVTPDTVWYNRVMAELGSNGVVYSIQAGQPVFTQLVCTTEYANTYPETITKLLRALYQAEEFIINRPEEAQDIVEKRLNFTNADLGWENYRFALSLDLPLLTAMRDEAQWMINNGLTNQTQVPDFSRYIFTDALKEVKPNSVTIDTQGG